MKTELLLWGIPGWVKLNGLAIFRSCSGLELPFWTVYIYRSENGRWPTFRMHLDHCIKGAVIWEPWAVSTVKCISVPSFCSKNGLLVCEVWDLTISLLHVTHSGLREILLLKLHIDLDALKAMWYFQKHSLQMTFPHHELCKWEDWGGEGRFQLAR